MRETQKQFMSVFTENLFEMLEPKKTLVVGVPLHDRQDPRDFPTIFDPSWTHQKTTFLDTDLGDDTEFDLILGSIPLGLPKSKNWDLFFSYSKLLRNNGVGLFLVEPYGLTRNKKDISTEFLSLMETEFVYINGYINLPAGILEPCTSIQPILVMLSRNKSKLRLLNLSKVENYDERLRNFLGKAIGDKKTESLDLFSFRGFRSIEIANQIDNLKTRYKEYQSVSLINLSHNLVKGNQNREFEDNGNCIYIKLLGSNNNLHTHKDQLVGRVDNYFQLQLTEQINNGYLKIFFKSSLGQLILDYVMNSQFIPRLNRELLMLSDIPTPDLSVQLQVVETDRRLGILQNEIDGMKRQISINPLSSSTSSQIDEMLRISNRLSEGDHIKSLVLLGESKVLEFKQSFQYCFRSKQKQDYVEVSSLKTVVGFLNSDGGTLLIGVEDSGLFSGIELEREKFHKKSNDKFLLHIKDKLKTRIGQSFMDYI